MILKEYTLNEIFDKLPDINDIWINNSVFIEHGIYKINLVSKRNKHKYKLFKKNKFCTICKAEGVKFLLELKNGCELPELNLYTSNNILINMDHIIPRAHGGTNEFRNFQTMCANCNKKKGANIFCAIPNVIKISSKKTLDKDVLELFGNKVVLEMR